MDRLVNTIRLMRPINCLMAMVGVWVGAYLTWVEPVYYAPAILGLAAFLVCGAGNALNDYFDIEIDRVNRPERILVRGLLSKRYVLVLVIGLNVTAVAMALTVGTEVTVVGVITIVFLVAYDWFLKKVPVAGNLVVALLAGLTFMTGGIAVDFSFAFELPGPLIAFAFAFLFHLVREIVKDVQDIEGDRQAGIRTLPQIIGVPRSLLLAIAVFLVLTIVTFLPVLAGWFGEWYKIIAVYIVELPLLGFLIFLWGNPTPTMLRVASGALKAGMALGIVALILA